MARVNIKFNEKRLASQVVRRINGVIDSEGLKQEIGLFSTDRIRFQARTGKPLNDTKSFPSLAERTKIRREYLARFNNTDATFEAGRSNITFTGQFLDSLSFERLRRGIRLLFKGGHKPYQGPNGRVGRAILNSKLDVFLRERGFDAFTAAGIRRDPKFSRQINNIVRRFLRRKLR